MKKYALLAMALVLVASTVAVAAVHIVGGPGNGGNTVPFYPQMPGMRWQTIWHKSDIEESGAVTKVEFQSVWIITTATFDGCKILLCHTTLGHVTHNFTTNYNGKTPVTVFSGTKVVPATPQGRWFTVAEPTNFTYNNYDNLLIEVSWVIGSPITAICHCYINTKGKAGRVFAFDPKAQTGSVDTDYDQIARLTLDSTGVEPTSLGRVKSIFK